MLKNAFFCVQYLENRKSRLNFASGNLPMAIGLRGDRKRKASQVLAHRGGWGAGNTKYLQT